MATGSDSAEAKDAATVRKNIGRGHIDAGNAALLDRLYTKSPNFYVNERRSPDQRVIAVDGKGHKHGHCSCCLTLCENLLSLGHPRRCSTPAFLLLRELGVNLYKTS